MDRPAADSASLSCEPTSIKDGVGVTAEVSMVTPRNISPVTPLILYTSSSSATMVSLASILQDVEHILTRPLVCAVLLMESVFALLVSCLGYKYSFFPVQSFFPYFSVEAALATSKLDIGSFESNVIHSFEISPFEATSGNNLVIQGFI